MIEHYIRRNRNGEAVWTIRITGANEIFRFAFHMIHGQVEFGEMGGHAFRYLRRKWGIDQLKKHDELMTDGTVVRHGWHSDRRGL